MPVWVAITDAPVYIRGQGGGGRGGSGGGWGHKSGSIVFRTDVIRYTQKGGGRCARGATKCYTQKHKCQLCYSISEPVVRSLQSCGRRPGSSDATSLQSRPKILEVLYFATACTRRSSSVLLHNALRSGTEKAMNLAARRARSCRMVRHPRHGMNLLMAGADLLNGGTGTPAVSQRSESGQGILGAKEGRGM